MLVINEFWFPLTSIVQQITMEASGYRNGLIINILQIIFFCVQQMTESHTGLEQHKGE